VWICGNNGKIYKQFSGVGSYVDQEQIARNWKGITVNLTNGDVYATVLSGIYVLKSSALGLLDLDDGTLIHKNGKRAGKVEGGKKQDKTSKWC
jgi:hypothetical protein